MRTTDVCVLPAFSKSARRPTSISRAFRAIVDEIDNADTAWDIDGTEGEPVTYRLKAACDRATRERAYKLAHRVYQGCGYISPASGNGFCVSNYDAQPETFTLLADDLEGSAAGTVTLIFDSVSKLPCDELYATALDTLREAGRLPVEVTRLVIAEDHRNSKALLLRLINFVSIYAVHVRHFTDFVIEVNPRHVNYYRRLLNFEVFGPERPCSRVNGAPAVLLRLDLSVYLREVMRVGGMGAAANERTLYPHFYPSQDESAVAQFLARNHKPMTVEEARYFGLDPVPTHQLRECVTVNG